VAIERFGTGQSIEVDSALATKLDEASAHAIPSWAERTTALVYLKQGLEVYYQVPIGDSVIDFLVKDSDSTIFLVEVKGNTEARIKQGDRQKRQIQSMERTGLPFFVFHSDDIKDMQRQYGIS
jgi:very-short-patch-repair endonuclease